MDYYINKVEYDEKGNRIDKGEGITPQVTPPPKVSEKYARLIEFCEHPRTRNEMQEFMRLKDKKNFMKNYVNPMIALGMIEMTDPDKPKSRNQRYVKTK